MRLKLPVFVILLIPAALFLAACGAVATPRAPADPTLEPFTLAPRPTSQATTVAGARATDQPTALPPTETATPTPVPPSATATPTWTRTPTPAAVGDAAAGEALFLNGKDGAPACVTCHFVDQDQVLVGPSMVGIASRAAERVPGQSAQEYLHNSILHPNDFIATAPEGRVYAANGVSLMFQTYADFLSDDDVNDLVAYMLTLTGE